MSRDGEGQLNKAHNARSSALVRAASGAALSLVGLFGSAAVVGCGNPLYALQVNAAARQLEHAREIGADRFAPYDYYSAQAYLEKAKEEAAAADYSDAIELAEKSEEYANNAVKRTDAARSKVQ